MGSMSEQYFGEKLAARQRQAIKDRRDKPVGSLQQALDANPNAERNMWIVVGTIFVVGLLFTPWSLLLSLPLAIFCFIERQQAAKRKNQANYNAMKERYDRMDAPTVPIAIVKQDRGRHASA